MKYNIRNLLWHMKHKGLEGEADKIRECKETLYDATVDNVNFFTDYRGNHLCANNDLYYSIPMSMFRSFPEPLTLDKLMEIQKRFNNAATGFFGLQFDNSANVILTDLCGNPFRVRCFYDKQKKTYELIIWDASGQRQLLSICTKEKKLTFEQVKEMEKCNEKLMEQYEKARESSNRYGQICKYRDYIRKEDVKFGYAHYTCRVYVRKDIPIDLTEHEIAKYADDWNYCFGGSIHKAGETENEKIYSVKVHTD